MITRYFSVFVVRHRQSMSRDVNRGRCPKMPRGGKTGFEGRGTLTPPLRQRRASRGISERLRGGNPGRGRRGCPGGAGVAAGYLGMGGPISTTCARARRTGAGSPAPRTPGGFPDARGAPPGSPASFPWGVATSRSTTRSRSPLGGYDRPAGRRWGASPSPASS